MGSKEFIALCRKEILAYVLQHVDVTDEIDTGIIDIYVVWYCKTLQNHKCLMSTNIADGMYYECTYNGDKKELYLDAYKKFENRCIHLDDK